MSAVSPSRTVRVLAPGKINASLLVGPPRTDGYHTVASVYLAVSLYEEVLAGPSTEPGVTLTMSSGGDGLDVPVDGLPLGPDNLAVRAAELVAAQLDRPVPGVRLHIIKRVPVAGGMGGGSADAAAALLACNLFWNAGLSDAELAALAARLGADVPFALAGAAAVGLGVGDRLTPVPVEGTFHWVLAAADDGLSTPEVYRTLDRLRDADGASVPEPTAADPAVLAALAAGDACALAAALRNDMQPAALALAPRLAETLDAGVRAGALAALVSGSGPTVAFLAADAAAASALERRLLDAGHRALAVTGPARGAHAVGHRDVPAPTHHTIPHGTTPHRGADAPADPTSGK